MGFDMDRLPELQRDAHFEGKELATITSFSRCYLPSPSRVLSTEPTTKESAVPQELAQKLNLALSILRYRITLLLPCRQDTYQAS